MFLVTIAAMRTYLRMRAAYEAHDVAGAVKEQNWKYSVEQVFSK